MHHNLRLVLSVDSVDTGVSFRPFPSRNTPVLCDFFFFHLLRMKSKSSEVSFSHGSFLVSNFSNTLGK